MNSKSKSNLIAFLDSDDFWSKEKLSKQIKFMKRNKLDFTFTDYILLSINLKNI